MQVETLYYLTGDKLAGEIELYVEGTFEYGLKGSRDQYGAPLEPDDEPEVTVESVSLKNNTEVTVDFLAKISGRSVAWIQAELENAILNKI
jgi:hypothetical protein